MKRTRQVFHYGEDAVPTDISGCRQFDGEDLRKLLILLTHLAFGDRQKHHADLQKQWVYEQKHEKNQIKNDEVEEERYDVTN